MSETRDYRNSRQTERALRTLNQALIKAKKKYKEKHGELPQDGYHFVLRDGMTYEEELLEIFHALVRSGMSPSRASLSPRSFGSMSVQGGAPSASTRHRGPGPPLCRSGC